MTIASRVSRYSTRLCSNQWNNLVRKAIHSRITASLRKPESRRWLAASPRLSLAAAIFALLEEAAIATNISDELRSRFCDGTCFNGKAGSEQSQLNGVSS